MSNAITSTRVEIAVPISIAFDPKLSASAVRYLESIARPHDAVAVATLLDRNLGHVGRMFAELREAGAIR